MKHKAKNNKKQYVPLNISAEPKSYKHLYIVIAVIIVAMGSLWLLYDLLTSYLNQPNQINKITEFKIVPHQTTCYSQGLFFLNKTHIFQSCGMYNQSYFHIMEFKKTETAFTVQETFKSKVPFNKDVFLEGATIFNNKIYVLTWKENIVFVLNRQNFDVQKTLKWNKQGWGLSNNSTHLFVTDGSNKIFTCDQNMTIREQKTVRDHNNRSVKYLNQLQYVNGYLWMNVYFSNKILKIDVQTGNVLQQIQCQKLTIHQPRHRRDEVLNGIAYNSQYDEYLLTGKDWNYFYEIKLS